MYLRKKAQSTLEYLVIVVGIVIAVLAAKSLLGEKVKKMIGEDSASAIDKSTGKFDETLDGYGK